MLELGGEDQIPFLVDTARDVTMYESDDIVDYLEEHYG
jgi:glutathione S-transferase